MQGTLELSPKDKEQIWQRARKGCFRGRNSEFQDRAELGRSEEERGGQWGWGRRTGGHRSSRRPCGPWARVWASPRALVNLGRVLKEGWPHSSCLIFLLPL